MDPNPKFVVRPSERENCLFSPLMLARIFVDIHQGWFTAKDNAFYGRRGEIVAVLAEYAETGEEDPNWHHEVIYAVQKFQQEWFEKYFEPVPEPSDPVTIVGE